MRTEFWEVTFEFSHILCAKRPTHQFSQFPSGFPLFMSGSAFFDLLLSRLPRSFMYFQSFHYRLHINTSSTHSDHRNTRRQKLTGAAGRRSQKRMRSTRRTRARRHPKEHSQHSLNPLNPLNTLKQEQTATET